MAPHGAAIPPLDQSNDLSQPRVDTTSFIQLMCSLPVSQSTKTVAFPPAYQSWQPHFSQRDQAERISFMDLMRGAGNGVWNKDNIFEDSSPIFNGSTTFRSVSCHAGTTHLDLPCADVIKLGMSNLGTPIDASGKMEKFSAQDRVSPGPFDSTILRSTNSLSGMHGTFLDLCPSSSRTTMLPGKNPNGYNPTSTFQIINEELTYKYGANAVHVTPDSPSRLVVDDSGYASSESSLYDVDSDDEDGALGFQDENNIEGHNLAGSSECPVNKICNAREQVPSTINQGDANPVEDCPCINGNPFMHVMAQVTEDTVQTVAWKKRCIGRDSLLRAASESRRSRGQPRGGGLASRTRRARRRS